MTTQVFIRWVIGFIAANVIVIGTLLVRAIVKWTRIQVTMEQLAEDIKEHITDSKHAHEEMYREMRDDRAATNKRLRFLEENFWTRKGGQ